MSCVRFFDACPEDKQLKYAVIVARYQEKWVFCRHVDRTTWEIPGGHLEHGETPEQAAFRELQEETGAVHAALTPVSIYAFNDFGALYFAEISELGEIPEGSEMHEIQFFESLPEDLTYPHIQPYLFDCVRDWLKKQ